MTGARVDRLGRRSKVLLLDLSTGETLLWHLGMSGRVLISGAVAGSFHHDHPPREPHDHVVFHMANGGRITFNDPRRFGAMDLTSTSELASHKWLASLGPEPLGNAFDGPYLAQAFAGRKTPVKAALLDQKTVAGLGNIYVSEALFRAGLSPKRHAGRIAKDRVFRACSGHSRRPDRGYRGRRILAPRPSTNLWRAWVFSAHLPGLRPRGRGLQDTRLRGHDPAHRAIGSLQLLLPRLSKIA